MAKLLQFGPGWLTNNINDSSPESSPVKERSVETIADKNDLKTDKASESMTSYSSILRKNKSTSDISRKDREQGNQNILIEKHYCDRSNGRRSSNIRLVDSSASAAAAITARNNNSRERALSVTNGNDGGNGPWQNTTDAGNSQVIHRLETMQTIVANSAGAYVLQTHTQSHSVINNLSEFPHLGSRCSKRRTSESRGQDLFQDSQEDLSQTSQLSPYAKPFEFRRAHQNNIVYYSYSASNLDSGFSNSTPDTEPRAMPQPFVPNSIQRTIKANNNEEETLQENNSDLDVTSISLSRRKYLSKLSADAKPFEFHSNNAEINNAACNVSEDKNNESSKPFLIDTPAFVPKTWSQNDDAIEKPLEKMEAENRICLTKPHDELRYEPHRNNTRFSWHNDNTSRKILDRQIKTSPVGYNSSPQILDNRNRFTNENLKQGNTAFEMPDLIRKQDPKSTISFYSRDCSNKSSSESSSPYRNSPVNSPTRWSLNTRPVHPTNRDNENKTDWRLNKFDNNNKYQWKLSPTSPARRPTTDWRLDKFDHNNKYQLRIPLTSEVRGSSNDQNSFFAGQPRCQDNVCDRENRSSNPDGSRSEIDQCRIKFANQIINNNSKLGSGAEMNNTKCSGILQSRSSVLSANNKEIHPNNRIYTNRPVNFVNNSKSNLKMPSEVPSNVILPNHNLSQTMNVNTKAFTCKQDEMAMNINGKGSPNVGEYLKTNDIITSKLSNTTEGIDDLTRKSLKEISVTQNLLHEPDASYKNKAISLIPPPVPPRRKDVKTQFKDDGKMLPLNSVDLPSIFTSSNKNGILQTENRSMALLQNIKTHPIDDTSNKVKLSYSVADQLNGPSTITYSSNSSQFRSSVADGDTILNKCSKNPFLMDDTSPLAPTFAGKDVPSCFSNEVYGLSGLTTAESVYDIKPSRGKNPFLDDECDNTDRETMASEKPCIVHLPKDPLWFYIDPNGQSQGPFTGVEMAEWFHIGYFSEDLKVRRNCDKRFGSIEEFMKLTQSSTPFLDSRTLLPLGIAERRFTKNTNPFLGASIDEVS